MASDSMKNDKHPSTSADLVDVPSAPPLSDNAAFIGKGSGSDASVSGSDADPALVDVPSAPPLSEGAAFIGKGSGSDASVSEPDPAE